MPGIASEPGRRRVRLTLRLRLTLLYGACFVVAGAGLLAITYSLFGSRDTTTASGVVFRAGSQARAGLSQAITLTRPKAGVAVSGPAHASGGGAGVQAPIPTHASFKTLQATGAKQIAQVVRGATIALNTQADQQQSALLRDSVLALAIMAVLSIALGWLLAGRALRPLRTMGTRARAITEENLHERLGNDTRDDELGELATTFDNLLARLERAFEAQRRFVANASHELRTPLTLERALVEVALADPNASVTSLRRTCERVLATSEEQERLIEALLTLARGQAGIEAPAAIDLRGLVRELVAERAPDPRQIELQTRLDPAVIEGDPALLERLITNLVDNAFAYNAEQGWVRLETGVVEGQPELRVDNSGPPVPSERVEELFEPFRRLDGDRTHGAGGLGLGLSIVRAIATAHGAEVRASSPEGGGLGVTVRFPGVAAGTGTPSPHPELEATPS